MLTEQLAESIVKETMARLNRNINIVDASGTILASGDRARIGSRHEGGMEAIRTGRPLVITKENESRWAGSKRGINLPLEFAGSVVGAIGITGEPEEVAAFGELVKMTTELMMRQSQLVSQREWRQRTMEAAAEELMRPQPDWPTVERRLDMLHMRAKPPFDVMLVELAAAEEPAKRDALLRRLLEALDCPQERLLAGWLGADKLLVVLSGYSPREAAKKRQLAQQALGRTETGGRIGVTEQAGSLRDVPAACRECEWALLLDESGGQLAAYADVETKALVRRIDTETAGRYAARVLKRLPGKMADTLQAFFDCDLNVAETAQALSVHRNTLLYRLARIKEVTGYDPKRFGDAVSLQLAVWMRGDRSGDDLGGADAKPARADGDLDGAGTKPARADGDLDGTGAKSTRADGGLGGAGAKPTRADGGLDGTGAKPTRADGGLDGTGAKPTRADDDR